MPSKYLFHSPRYSAECISATGDTIVFPLDSSTYGRVKSFNYFIDNGNAYISFYERRTQSVNIYDFHSRKLFKRIFLQEILQSRKLKKTTVFVKDLDSLLIHNNYILYIVNSSSLIVDSISYAADRYLSLSAFDNMKPPIFNGGVLYAEARPRLFNTKKSDLKKWKVLYKFDMNSKDISLIYHLPKIYQENIYGYRFFNKSYCYNNNDRLVFSFPADTNIYETNLTDYHMAYYGKSYLQTGNIEPVMAEEITNGEGIAKTYLLRDSYGAIYFDPYHKRYLRVAYQKITNQDYYKRRWDKTQSIIIFDEYFRIIGESKINNGVSLDYLFVTSDGCIYARTRITDEKYLSFVRLEYEKGSNKLFK